MADLVRRLETIARSESGRVTAVRVRIGALSHFSEASFRTHFAEASQGTAAHGAAVEVVEDPDATARHAQGVLLESVDVAAD